MMYSKEGPLLFLICKDHQLLFKCPGGGYGGGKSHIKVTYIQLYLLTQVKKWQLKADVDLQITIHYNEIR